MLVGGKHGKTVIVGKERQFTEDGAYVLFVEVPAAGGHELATCNFYPADLVTTEAPAKSKPSR